MDQIGYAFLVYLMAIVCSIIWPILSYFRPSSLVFSLEQNSKITETTKLLDGTTPNMSYAGVRPKQKVTVTLTPQLKPKTKPCREDNHIIHVLKLP